LRRHSNVLAKSFREGPALASNGIRRRFADEYFSMAVTGVAVMFAALLLQLIWPGRVYVLILRTSSGDVAAITSRNKEFVSNLQKAVEQAFIVRAREPPVSEAGSSR
jgi:Family of unknown function (DUF6232)